MSFFSMKILQTISNLDPNMSLHYWATSILLDINDL